MEKIDFFFGQNIFFQSQFIFTRVLDGTYCYSLKIASIIILFVFIKLLSILISYLNTNSDDYMTLSLKVSLNQI